MERILPITLNKVQHQYFLLRPPQSWCQNDCTDDAYQIILHLTIFAFVHNKNWSSSTIPFIIPIHHICPPQSAIQIRHFDCFTFISYNIPTIKQVSGQSRQPNYSYNILQPCSSGHNLALIATVVLFHLLQDCSSHSCFYKVPSTRRSSSYGLLSHYCLC